MIFADKFTIKILLPGVLCAMLLTACDLSEGLLIDSLGATTANQTAVSVVPGVVETIQPSPTGNVPDPTIESTLPDNKETTSVELIPEVGTQTEASPCNQASAGIPLDVTIPDDTRLEPDTGFTKIWRLVNSGSCTWTNGYSVVWFSGDDFRAARQQTILTDVLPGQTAEIVVDMISPPDPGLYSGFWMLQSEDGDLFGIGPNGNSPFWVRIQVQAVITETPTITPTVVPTLIVFSTGTVSLLPGKFIDLDSGDTLDEDHADSILEQASPVDYQWSARNGGRFSMFGLSEPGELECTLATLSDEPIILTYLEAGTYFCYRTGEGLPGRLKIESLPVGGSPMIFTYTTWAAP